MPCGTQPRAPRKRKKKKHDRHARQSKQATSAQELSKSKQFSENRKKNNRRNSAVVVGTHLHAQVVLDGGQRGGRVNGVLREPGNFRTRRGLQQQREVYQPSLVFGALCRREPLSLFLQAAATRMRRT
jgi:hypothetical protein